MQKTEQNRWTVTTILKYIFAVLLTLLTYMTTRSLGYIAFGLIELCMIFVISDFLVQKNKVLGYIVNILLMTLYCSQMGVLFFGNSYIELVMLSNLSSLEDLGGKAIQYGIGVVGVIVFVCLPIRGGMIRFGKIKEIFALPLLVVMECVLAFVVGLSSSPFYNYYALYEQYNVMKDFNDALLGGTYDEQVELYTGFAGDYRSKEETISEQPNVILIFTEGLSQSIVEDERNITPNIAAFEEKSLYFDNYYNHTFATYRGLSGSIYSGYQLNNTDENKLPSLQSIFKENGYSTTWINTEPENEEFSDYLEGFGFDEVITQEENRSGLVNSMSDKEAYEMLLDTAVSKNENEEPFFISMYTFGTHASLYSVNEVFGDGSNGFLNKFYDMDYQFGEFLEAFENSELAENTIIVFTADHATYADNDFTNAFPDYQREHSMVDEIPLCIYYVGMEAETIDVNGRNTLGLAPTILDYLDIAAENNFLGTSLFSGDEISDFDMIFNEEGTILSTANGEISSISSEETTRLRQMITQYFHMKLSDDSDVSTENFDAFAINAEISDDESWMKINYQEEDSNYIEVRIAVWSEASQQADLQWFDAENLGNGIWSVEIDLTPYGTGQMLNIHVYCDGSYKSATTIVP